MLFYVCLVLKNWYKFIIEISTSLGNGIALLLFFAYLFIKSPNMLMELK